MPLLVELRQSQSLVSATKNNNTNTIFGPNDSDSSGTRNRL